MLKCLNLHITAPADFERDRPFLTCPNREAAVRSPLRLGQDLIDDISPDQASGCGTDKECYRELGKVFNVVEVQDDNRLDTGYDGIIKYE